MLNFTMLLESANPHSPHSGLTNQCFNQQTIQALLWFIPLLSVSCWSVLFVFYISDMIISYFYMPMLFLCLKQSNWAHWRMNLNTFKHLHNEQWEQWEFLLLILLLQDCSILFSPGPLRATSTLDSHFRFHSSLLCEALDFRNSDAVSLQGMCYIKLGLTHKFRWILYKAYESGQRIKN